MPLAFFNLAGQELVVLPLLGLCLLVSVVIVSFLFAGAGGGNRNGKDGA